MFYSVCISLLKIMLLTPPPPRSIFILLHFYKHAKMMCTHLINSLQELVYEIALFTEHIRAEQRLFHQCINYTLPEQAKQLMFLHWCVYPTISCKYIKHEIREAV